MNDSSSTQLDLFNSGFEANPKPTLWKGFTKSLKKIFTSEAIVQIEYRSRLKNSFRFQTKDKRAIVGAPIRFKEIEGVEDLLYKWAEACLLCKSKNSSSHRQKEQQYRKALIGYLTISKPKRKINDKSKLLNGLSKGIIWDLEEILRDVNEKYFNDEIKAKIRWNIGIGGTSWHREYKLEPDNLLEKINHKNEKSLHLISLSRGYDFSNCPKYCIEALVYHECLHILCPPIKGLKRRNVHHQEFRRRERLFPQYSEWILWHKTIHAKNLRALKVKGINFR